MNNARSVSIPAFRASHPPPPLPPYELLLSGGVVVLLPLELSDVLDEDCNPRIAII